jgi:hypothetical protein
MLENIRARTIIEWRLGDLGQHDGVAIADHGIGVF